MSENEIKPVAWVEIGQACFAPPSEWDLRNVAWATDDQPLYDQTAIDRLTAERDAAVAEVARVKASVGAIHFGVRAGFSAQSILVECVSAAPELAALDAARSEGGV